MKGVWGWWKRRLGPGAGRREEVSDSHSIRYTPLFPFSLSLSLSRSLARTTHYTCTIRHRIAPFLLLPLPYHTKPLFYLLFASLEDGTCVID